MGCAHGSSAAHAPIATPGQVQQHVGIGRPNATLLAAPLGDAQKQYGAPAPNIEPNVSGAGSVHAVSRTTAGDDDIFRLHKASRDGDLEMVLLCLKSADDVQATIEAQSWIKYFEVGSKYFEAGSNVSKSGPPSLYIASSHGHASVVRALLNAGAAIGGKGASGETALHAAANFGHPEVARILLAAGADVDARDAQGMTALHWAARMSRKDVAEILVEAGASLTACSGHGYTAYAMAEDWGTAAVAGFLEMKGGRR